MTKLAKENEMTTIWKIVDDLVEKQFKNISRYAVLILNRPIRINEELVVSIWNEASLCATADGGTDSWYNFVASLRDKKKINKFHPDLVSGDFDSIRPETLKYCKNNGVNVVETPDQENTDFTKAVEEILKHCKDKIDNIIVFTEHSGRLDHTLSNMNTLYTVMLKTSVKIVLMASDGLTWLLNPGVIHQVHIPQSLVQTEATCGLLPLGAPCVVKTSGLKWNLDNTKLEFGGLISSCNTFSQNCQGVVTIETDSALLWTVNIKFGEQCQ